MQLCLGLYRATASVSTSSIKGNPPLLQLCFLKEMKCWPRSTLDSSLLLHLEQALKPLLAEAESAGPSQVTQW